MRRVVRALLQRGGHDLELQVRSAGRVPTTGHDASVELIGTPDQVIDCRLARPEPAGRDSLGGLTEEKIAAVPLLRELQAKAGPTDENVRM
jgi:5-formyltetrahydrofolate cyclo-ligase